MKIGLYGDSTQAGASVYGGAVSYAEYTPAVVLQMTLDRQFGQGVHTVSNYGIGGSTIKDALDTGIFGGKTFEQHMLAQNDDIIVANWGINDAYIPSITPSAHASDYNRLKSIVEQSGKVFIYETPNPMNNVHNDILKSLISAVKSINSIDIIDVNYNVERWYPEYALHLSDGVHPNTIMYDFIGKLLHYPISLKVS